MSEVLIYIYFSIYIRVNYMVELNIESRIDIEENVECNVHSIDILNPNLIYIHQTKRQQTQTQTDNRQQTKHTAS